MFSIIIPTFNNLIYLKVCINSLRKNSIFNHQIIPHVNIGDDGTEEYLKSEEIDYTITKYNSGICEGMNLAAKKANFNYILYAHDDFYFCPEWDTTLINEVKKIGHKNFYLSGIMMNNGPLKYNCGNDLSDFNENKLLSNYKDINHYDFQGSTWAPTLVHKEIWNKVGGFSEEFFPGTGSDPDLNMKLWNENVRIFKGVALARVYHFGSLTTRKNKNIIPNKGKKTFLLKWKVTVEFFTKHILKRGTEYDGPISEPKRNFSFYYDLLISKIKYLIAYIS